jgi:hypothetical protein
VPFCQKTAVREGSGLPYDGQAELVEITLAPYAMKALVRFGLALFEAGCHLDCRYWPPAGDTVLGVASVLLVLGALMPGVALLLFGRPEFGDPAPMPLSELGVPGVP